MFLSGISVLGSECSNCSLFESVTHKNIYEWFWKVCDTTHFPKSDQGIFFFCGEGLLQWVEYFSAAPCNYGDILYFIYIDYLYVYACDLSGWTSGWRGLHMMDMLQNATQNYNRDSGSLLQFHNWTLHVSFYICHMVMKSLMSHFLASKWGSP